MALVSASILAMMKGERTSRADVQMTWAPLPESMITVGGLVGGVIVQVIGQTG